MSASTPRNALREQGRGLRASVGVIVTFRHDLLARWPLLLGALGCALAFAAARLLEPWPLKYIFDNVLAARPFDSPIPGLDGVLDDSKLRILAAATIAILLLAGLRGVFFAWETLLTTRVGQEVVLRLRRKLFAHLQRHSLDFHAENSTGDLLTRLTSDVSMLRELLVGALLGIISEGIVLIGFLVVMLWMEWRLAVIAIVAMPLVFAIVTAYSGRIRAATRKQRATEGELAGRLEEVLSGIHLVQLFAREDDENDRLRRLNKRSLRTGLQSARLEASLNRWVELSIALTTALTLWFGATQVIAGRMTPGDLIVFVAYMQSFYRPLKRISRVARRAAKAGVSVERIMDVLGQEPDVRDGATVAPRFRGALQLEGVTFSYRDGQPVLRDVDLSVEAGQTIALVGPTGAGKSTLVGLVPRLRDVTAGAVRIDGRDVRELTLKSLRDQISVVPQDGMLFGGTVRENIAYGKPDATDAEIEAAARAALIHDFVVSLPDGYDTELAERGVTFSGGQRQRLAIARAIVKDAPIVILDEPTTGLDAESEHLVITALERLLQGRTALVIAHRLSTIRRADAIVVLDEGRIVEHGRHDELLSTGGMYHRLHELQTNPSAARPGPISADPATPTMTPPVRRPESGRPSTAPAPAAGPRRRPLRSRVARFTTRLIAPVGVLAGAAVLALEWPDLGDRTSGAKASPIASKAGPKPGSGQPGPRGPRLRTKSSPARPVRSRSLASPRTPASAVQKPRAGAKDAGPGVAPKPRKSSAAAKPRTAKATPKPGGAGVAPPVAAEADPPDSDDTGPEDGSGSNSGRGSGSDSSGPGSGDGDSATGDGEHGEEGGGHG